MKKKLLITALVVVAMVCMFAVSVSAAAPTPQKPTLDVDFGEVNYIDGFTAPSELYVGTTERFVLDLGEGNYVTYPTYYITKNQAAFDVDFGKLNTALGGTSYSKANIAMLEIPEGITTINNNTFSGTGYTVCKYVQFPSTITTFGNNVFNTNKAAQIVEFVDGTEPLAIGDGMFSGAWNGGTVIEYVKFSNNTISIGNNAFGKTVTNKTIILGENLKSIGTGFFSESTPGDKDTFVYASADFFADTEMFSNLFGSFDQWHSNYIKITLFYTGTEQQAKDFVDKGKAVQTGYIWDDNKVTLVSTSDYIYDTHKPTQNASLTMVYDYNACDAFYNSVHENSAPIYDFVGEDYISDFCESVACVNCGKGTSTKVIDPIFTSRGYSRSDDAFMFDIMVNADALAQYNEMYPEAQISYGLVVSANQSIDKLIGADGEILDASVLKVNLGNADYKNIQTRLNNIKTEELKALSVHACAYVIAGDKVSYIGQKKTSDVSTLISYNDISGDEA